MAFTDRILPAPVGGGFAMEGYWVWCGSAIRGSDGRYHLFAARWPQRYPFFDGYRLYSEVVHATSDSPVGPYTFRDVALPPRGEEYWDGRMTHNPTIHRLGDSYLLFYIGATWTGPEVSPAEIASSHKPAESYASIRIGLATSSSLDGPWQRRDEPILLPRPGQWDGSVVTNPAPCVLGDGRILMLYRSNTPEGLRIGATMAESPAGTFVRISDQPVLRLGSGNAVEDPFVWWNGSGLEMLAKDMTGGITGERHAGVHLTSSDGVHWALATPPKAYSRRVVWDDGAVTVQGSLERPQLLIENGRPTHLFAATADGPGGFDNARRTWNMVIPLAP
jgi:hypothetical protein